MAQPVLDGGANALKQAPRLFVTWFPVVGIPEEGALPIYSRHQELSNIVTTP